VAPSRVRSGTIWAGVIVDLHTHFPMHLAARPRRGFLRRLPSLPHRRWRIRDIFRGLLLNIASRVGNYQSFSSGPRSTVPLMEAGGVGVGLSVLYSPFDEMDLGPRYPGPPSPDYFPRLIRQLELVERDVAKHFEGQARVVHTPDELDATIARRQLALVHCVEGGFHLGATTAEIDRNVSELARRGVAYITVAHLFYRLVATNTNAIPFLPDRIYNLLFPQPPVGLTELGRALVRAMVAEGILIDLSHISARGTADALKLLDDLDPGRTVPLIASHVGFRFGRQQYNLDAQTIERIAERDGVIGLILSEHQAADGLPHPRTLDDSVALLSRHIDRIREITGSHLHAAIGSDHDGFIKPTLPGLEDAGRLGELERALRAGYGDEDATAIASGNALRVLHAGWRGADAR
jgi:microsomal dipeptidase-like Zn-dependent dipeptidase